METYIGMRILNAAAVQPVVCFHRQLVSLLVANFFSLVFFFTWQSGVLAVEHTAAPIQLTLCRRL